MEQKQIKKIINEKNKKIKNELKDLSKTFLEFNHIEEYVNTKEIYKYSKKSPTNKDSIALVNHMNDYIKLLLEELYEYTGDFLKLDKEPLKEVLSELKEIIFIKSKFSKTIAKSHGIKQTVEKIGKSLDRINDILNSKLNIYREKYLNKKLDKIQEQKKFSAAEELEGYENKIRLLLAIMNDKTILNSLNEAQNSDIIRGQMTSEDIMKAKLETEKRRRESERLDNRRKEMIANNYNVKEKWDKIAEEKDDEEDNIKDGEETSIYDSVKS